MDLVVQTTWTASTSYIPFASRHESVAYIPTTFYLEGGGVLTRTEVRKYTTNGVQINRQAVRYNILKLRYIAIGELVRP